MVRFFKIIACPFLSYLQEINLQLADYPVDDEGLALRTVVDHQNDEINHEEKSSPPKEFQIEATLNSFRDQWHRELSEGRRQKIKDENVTSSNEQVFNEDFNVEALATKWFTQGVEFEKKGNLYEAIRFYRKAVQLVPDIEFRFYESLRNLSKDRSTTTSTEDLSHNDVDTTMENLSLEDAAEKDELLEPDLISRFQRYVSRKQALCLPANQQTSTHISKLPVELLLYIFRWVVSTDLDVRSLEMCSRVCRGFYLLSRDSEIWRLACLRVWGVNCGGLVNCATWRDMYLTRPRLNFSGVYISKTSYVRHGENSFQDQFYRPWHVVEYFRYLRFFPEGLVLMLTTPEGPVGQVPILSQLRTRNSKNPSIMIGHYRMHGDRVTLILHRERNELNNNNTINNKRYWGAARRRNAAAEVYEQAFHIELEVRPWKHRINWQLVWSRYCVLSKRGATETVTDFEMISNKFPPFWFSRVKSYTSESERPLT